MLKRWALRFKPNRIYSEGEKLYVQNGWIYHRDVYRGEGIDLVPRMTFLGTYLYGPFEKA